VRRDVAYIFACFRIIDNRTAWHLYIFILTVFSCQAIGSSVTSIAGKDMFLITQMEQSPHVTVAAEDNVPATATVAAVRPAIIGIFGMVKVHGATAAFSTAARNSHMVYEVALRHVDL
jgi:hypothetical protein